MSPPVQKKPEHIQVKVLNVMLDVRGSFDPRRMERAGRTLDAELKRRVASGQGDLQEQNALSIALLTAIEKIYAMEQAREEKSRLEFELSEWRRWAEERASVGGFTKDAGKE
jgi:hypothetical protein